MLSNPDIHQCYGEKIWSYVPTQWRPWWFHSLQTEFPAVFSDITMDSPRPLIEDKTIDRNSCKDDLDSYVLPRLTKTWNHYFRPVVKCPWGCSEFVHKVGFLPLDLIFRRLLQKCSFKKMMTTNDSSRRNKVTDNYSYKVRSIREDYIRQPEDSEDMLLLNTDWMVMPSVANIPGKGFVFLTCREHDQGTNLFMIHVCRWKHNLPSLKPDQLCQVVSQPRTLKPVKASQYSISYELFQQTGSFNGIDTCSATSFGKFDFYSLLLAEAEARSIFNRPDIAAHLKRLRQEKVISKYIEQGKRQHATDYSSTIDYEKYYYGGTYVSLETSMILQREAEGRRISGWIHDNDHNIEKRFKRYWPLVIYPCQTMTNHGVLMMCSVDL